MSFGAPLWYDGHHADLVKFNEFADEDVEMKPPGHTLYLVLDTNVLLHYLEVVKQFVTDIERESEGRDLPLIIKIPKAVISELDAQKKGNDRIAWFARAASKWLLQKIQEKRCLKGQAMHETYNVNEDRHGITNDESIVRCAAYFNRLGQTFLCSGDRNLCIMAEAEWVKTINPQIPQWCSRSIAEIIFEDKSAEFINHFETWKRASYKNKSSVRSEEELAAINNINSQQDDDAMDVDQVPPTEDADDTLISESDARTSLHVQVVDHFTASLRELVARINQTMPLPAAPTSLSIHAAKRARLLMGLRRDGKYYTWTAADILAHLEYRKPGSVPELKPALELFLTKPYTKGVQGCRTGAEYSAAQWGAYLRALRKIGKDWEEDSIEQDIGMLVEDEHLDNVFGTGVIRL